MCWTIGELAIRAPEQMKPELTEAISIIAELLNSKILENLMNFEMKVQSEKT